MIGKSAVAGNIDDETVVQRSMKWCRSAASCVLSVSIERILTSERVTNAERAQEQDVSSGVRATMRYSDRGHVHSTRRHG